MANPLAKLTRQADAVAEKAAVLLERTIREITRDIKDLDPRLNITGNAKDRERVYNLVRRRYKRLSAMLDALVVDQQERAGKAAAKAASEDTGIEVKYSARRAEAICEAVSNSQGENLAAVFTDRMSAKLITSLRDATVATLRDAAIIGGSLKEQKRDLAVRWADLAGDMPVFTDSSGRKWNPGAYLQMNIRTNTMRVYNDCLIDDIARGTGGDLVRVSRGGDPMCRYCAPWEGIILSISGKTRGFPSYEEAKEAGLFHPNCVHTLGYVDEAADAAEIALQRAHPATDEESTEPDAADERRYEIDQARYRENGMTKAEARLAVDRDNLTDNIRHGLVRADAREIVDGMTDAQINALCKDGNPPRFEAFKATNKEIEKGAKETWRKGSRGGCIHVSRKADLAQILKVAGLS